MYKINRYIPYKQLVRWHTLAPGEPRGPSIKTAVPGPVTLQHKKDLNEHFLTNQIRVMTDLHKSIGNYLADADGNIFLDLYPQGGTLPLGYNNENLLKIFKDKRNLKIFINRPAMGKYPGSYWYDKLSGTMQTIAPVNMPRVTALMCGSCAIENVMKVMFIGYAKMMRAHTDNFSAEEMKTAVINKPPGCPEFVVLSFENSNHTATTAGCNTISHNNPIEKVGLAKDWPIAPVPKYIYPLEDNVQNNLLEDQKCLLKVEELIRNYNQKKQPVVGVIIQTIQEMNSHLISGNFIKGLQGLCKKYNCYFAIDEANTGCGLTGKWWDVSHLELEEPPDILSFSNMTQFGGFYRNKQIFSKPYRVFNTWFGDPGRVLVLEGVLKEIKEKKLLQNAKSTGDHLLKELKGIQKEFPDVISYVSGRGLVVGIVCKTTDEAVSLWNTLFSKGVICGISGSTILIRPSITLAKHHCDIFADILRKSLQSSN